MDVEKCVQEHSVSMGSQSGVQLWSFVRSTCMTRSGLPIFAHRQFESTFKDRWD